MVQFDAKRRTLPRLDMPAFYFRETGEIRKEAGTGAAWLSSARVVRCWVKSSNERNPYEMLNFHLEPLPLRQRKVGMTSSQHGPYVLGYTRATMGRYNGSPSRKTELIPSNRLSVRIEGCNSPS